MAGADITRACPTCGTGIRRHIRADGKPFATTARFCSEACRAKGRRSKAREAGTPIRTKPRFRQAVCRVCGTSFMSRPSGKSDGGWVQCCSRRCGQNLRLAREGKFFHVLVRTHHGHCKHCGKHFQKGRPDTLYCSPECAKAPAYEWEPAVRACAVCGCEFTQAKKWQRTCSAECEVSVLRKQRRVAKSRRRARIRGANHQAIDPLAVFARDGWRCQLCGAKTPKRLRGTYEPRAPELDHIVALACGGSHTWGNVQCLCRQCNHAKGSKARGQLGLPFAA